MLIPDPELAGKLISGGGCLLIGTDGEVGETTALFSLPGPTLPGSILCAALGELAVGSANAGIDGIIIAAVTAAAMSNFLVMEINPSAVP